ncbi:MAG: SpoIIIAH-like family protein [Clostridia bacterium]|nr:SpoIIIAH-like family protein [Clostridia bacterium]
MEKKINMEKVKQMTLVVCGVILLGVGFMNYNSNSKEEVSTEIAVTDVGNRIGDAQLVSSNAIVENENTIASAVVENETNTVQNEVVSEDYFTKTKLERDEMCSKMLENYQKIIDNKELPETQKSIAVQEIDKINKSQNSIMIAENLIKNKGFEDAVILVNNNVVNVVVKSSFLSNEDIGKIQNIIEREFDVDLSNVNISSKK